jgi:hypothetical protein
LCIWRRGRLSKALQQCGAGCEHALHALFEGEAGAQLRSEVLAGRKAGSRRMSGGVGCGWLQPGLGGRGVPAVARAQQLRAVRGVASEREFKRALEVC